MSFFQESKNFDARHGLFSSVAGNQHNTVTTVTGTHFSVARDVIIQYGSHESYPVRGFSTSPLPNHLCDILALGRCLTLAVNLLCGSATASGYQDLIAELESLAGILQQVCARFAITCWQNQDVVNAINFQAAQCHAVMNHFCDNLQNGSPRRRYWRKDFIPDDVTSLRQKLSVHRAAISTFLELSVSYRKVPAENIGINQITALQREIPHSVGYTHDNGVRLVDALGRSIVLPMEFCFTPARFAATLKALFIDRAGQQYVERGDYALSCDEGKHIISAKECDTMMKIGTVLNMSIILLRIDMNHSKGCPRCHHENMGVVPSEGWIDCRHCDARFQISEMENAEEILLPDSGKGKVRELIGTQHGQESEDEVRLFRYIHEIQLSVWRIIERCWRRDPSERRSAQVLEIIKAIQQP